jgi:hypothetical protein
MQLHGCNDVLRSGFPIRVIISREPSKGQWQRALIQDIAQVEVIGEITFRNGMREMSFPEHWNGIELGKFP